ncbi:MAG: NADH-quinone oxidoreductase subunit NuoK [bacterium]|nr:NADH-quinone oxidoreductase subunit NuoK [bacterium]
MSLTLILAASTALFALGTVMFISRKNSIAILMGVELLMNAAALNFMGFSYYSPAKDHPLDGQIFALFIILIAAAEAVVALGIAIAVYKEYAHVQADQLNQLEG